MCQVDMRARDATLWVESMLRSISLSYYLVSHTLSIVPTPYISETTFFFFSFYIPCSLSIEIGRTLKGHLIQLLTYCRNARDQDTCSRSRLSFCKTFPGQGIPCFLQLSNCSEQKLFLTITSRFFLPGDLSLWSLSFL